MEFRGRGCTQRLDLYYVDKQPCNRVLLLASEDSPQCVSGTDNELYESVKEEQDDASSIHLSD